VKNATNVTEAAYEPVHAFADFPVDHILSRNITDRGYRTPTPIQDQAIPHILIGRDVVGIANTGTGKTAAFLIPLIRKTQNDRSQRILIIAPTRELALQIQDECHAFTRNTGIRSVICIGGVGYADQMQALRQSPQFVIGTPGRLMDLEEKRTLDFSQFRTIVLDEVDRMLDMGFINDVTYIISRLPAVRQSLCFSATVPENVEGLMNSMLRDPVRISVKIRETPVNVDQDIVRLAGRQKADVLHDLLKKDGFDKVLVFGRTKWGMDKLAKFLSLRGVRVAAIHSNRSQNQRQRALENFKSARIQVLLATDIASRGLDIDRVTHVINYDLPGSYEDYIHRIGRTGRVDRKGTALTFIE
jgi:superfamily II DNA/RNA helicase